MPTQEDWVRLGDHVRAARLAAKFRSREPFAAALDITTRTLGDIENGELGKRKSFAGDTMANIERAVGWPVGTWRRILADPNFVPDAEPSLDIDVESTVSAGPEDGDTLLFRRPDGLSDREWEALKSRERSHWEWEISQAAQER